MALVLKICGSEWENASRDKRELSVYREMGYEVAVLAKGNSADKGRVDQVDGFNVYRYSTRPLGNNAPAFINRFVSLFKWASFVRKLRPDVISGHDLMPGLTIGWLSTLFNKNKIKLIYDSHEFEIGRNVKRSITTAWLIKAWEKYLMNKCAFSIVVNHSIAEEVFKIHQLKDMPIVVRSTPNYTEIDSDICAKRRDEILEKFNNDTFIVMYHGVITSGRGIETLIELVSYVQETCGVIIGNGTKAYKDSLVKYARELKVEERIMFHEAVPAEVLWQYVGAADVSLMMISKSAKSYYYALPNKFFESIQALTPIIASNFPEMQHLIEEYNIGMACDPDDMESIINAIHIMHYDMNTYNKYKKNLQTAKKELCWEKEKKSLEKAFKRYVIEPYLIKGQKL